MIRAVVFFLALFAGTLAHAQLSQFPPGTFQSRAAIDGGKTFAGIGDCAGCNFGANAKMWGGLIGYTGADVADPADVCLPADTTCAHLTLAAGNVVIPASLSTCNITTVLCTVKTLFDKVGTNCSGPSACDLVQLTEASRFLFRPPMAANGCSSATKPCMLGRSGAVMNTTGTLTQALPLTYTIVAAANASDVSDNVFLNLAGPAFGFKQTNVAFLTDTAFTTVTAAAAAGSFHAIQGVVNGATSDVNVDGTVNTVTLGGIGTSNTMRLGDTVFVGAVSAVGVRAGASSSAESTAVSNNAKLNWGY